MRTTLGRRPAVRGAAHPPLVRSLVVAVAVTITAGLVALVPATPADAAPRVADPGHPTAAEVAAQEREADRLDREADRHRQAVTNAQVRLVRLSDQAGAALEAHERAQRERDEALAEEVRQLRRLAAARALLGRKEGELGRWASRSYREGITHSELEGLMTLLEAESTDDLTQRLEMLQRVGRMRGEVVATVAAAEAVQADATARAEQASAAAAAAETRAAAAKADADRLLAEQQDQLELLRDLLASTGDAAQAAHQRTEQLTAARAVAEQRRLEASAASRSGRRNAVTGPVGECTGGDVARYPNGAIPVSALCPLWGAPGHVLRADAAHAFNQLSERYAAEHGQPLCVTDSYRSLQSQVALKAAKPVLAADPGTSNHGWGTAVDLCGGVQSFGTPQHAWMRAHAPLHGFFHPTWAQAGGSKPEPWHWEYGL